jgi:choline kinase
MKAIILAAGRGNRMGTLTDNQPKCRTMLLGKSLIEWQMEALNKAGIKEIAIVRGYLADTFEFDVKYFDNSRWADTNMVVSLCSAEEWLNKYVCIVAYSDILYSSRVIKNLLNSDGDMAISYDKNWKKLWESRFDDPLSDAETFRINNKGLLLEIGNQPSSLDQIEGQYMGLLKFTPRGWQQIHNFLVDLDEFKRNNLDMTALLSLMIKQYKLKVHTVPSDDWWFEIDNVNDLSICEAEAKKGGLTL